MGKGAAGGPGNPAPPRCITDSNHLATDRPRCIRSVAGGPARPHPPQDAKQALKGALEQAARRSQRRALRRLSSQPAAIPATKVPSSTTHSRALTQKTHRWILVCALLAMMNQIASTAMTRPVTVFGLTSFSETPELLRS